MKKALIIGAGPAGLTAAYELLDKSSEYEVIVFEESNKIGGISRTVEYKGYGRPPILFKGAGGKCMVGEDAANAGKTSDR